MTEEGQQGSIPAASLHSELFDRPTYESTLDLARRYVAANAVLTKQAKTIEEQAARITMLEVELAPHRMTGKERLKARVDARRAQPDKPRRKRRSILDDIAPEVLEQFYKENGEGKE